MKRLFVLVALGLLILAASCKTLNVGNDRFPSFFNVTVTVPADMNGGRTADWVVAWTGGTSPYTITFGMGGGATPDTFTGTAAASPFTHTFTMVNASTENPATYTYTITVTSANGLTRTVTGSYTVGKTLNTPPTITLALNGTDTVTATVNDVDNDPLVLTATPSAGMVVSPTTANDNPPYTTVDFGVSATDFLAGLTNGTLTVDVSDGVNPAVPAQITIPNIPGFIPAADTIYALPVSHTAAVDDPVRIAVVTGVPANPFLYVNGCGITFQGAVDAGKLFIHTSGGYYIPNSFDIGVPDDTPDAGAANPVDGIWTALGTTNFIFAPDFLVDQGTDIGGGRVRIDFNVTPLNGSQSTTAEGGLFNFELGFGVAGTYTLGFQQFETVNRTYYSDASATEYFWGTLMADETGALSAGVTVDNTITVN